MLNAVANMPKGNAPIPKDIWKPPSPNPDLRNAPLFLSSGLLSGVLLPSASSPVEWDCLFANWTYLSVTSGLQPLRLTLPTVSPQERRGSFQLISL